MPITTYVGQSEIENWADIHDVGLSRRLSQLRELTEEDWLIRDIPVVNGWWPFRREEHYYQLLYPIKDREYQYIRGADARTMDLSGTTADDLKIWIEGYLVGYKDGQQEKLSEGGDYA